MLILASLSDSLNSLRFKYFPGKHFLGRMAEELLRLVEEVTGKPRAEVLRRSWSDI